MSECGGTPILAESSAGAGDASHVTSTSLGGGKTGIDVSGQFTFSGLSSAIRVTTLDIGTSELALPAAALSGRNSMLIHNTDGANTLYIGPTGVTADNVVGTTSGKEIAPGEEWGIDITDGIVVYGISTATIRVKVTEFA